jgi:ribosomal protein L40E
VQQRQFGQGGPSITVCPNCQTTKDPHQVTCSNCNTRSCANGHILSDTARICHICNWVDHMWKAPPLLHASSIKTVERSTERAEHALKGRCTQCGATLDPRWLKCVYCGTPTSGVVEEKAAVQDSATSSPPRVETHTVNRRRDNVSTNQYQQTRPAMPSPAYQSPTPDYTVISQNRPIANPGTGNVCATCNSQNSLEARFCRTCGSMLDSNRISYPPNMNNRANPQSANPIPGRAARADWYRATSSPDRAGMAPNLAARQRAAKPENLEPGRKSPLGLIFGIFFLITIVIIVIIFFLGKA